MLDAVALFVRLQGNLHRNGALGGGLGVRVADVVDHAAHLVIKPFLNGAVCHINKAACFGLFHVVCLLWLWCVCTGGQMLRPHFLSVV